MKRLIGVFVLIFLFGALLGCGTSNSSNQTVAFMSSLASGSTYQINTMKNDGTSVTAVGTPDTFFVVQLSPDDKNVAFSYWDSTSDHYQIGIMKADGSGRKALTTSGTDKWYLQFTPDGSKIMYTSYSGSGSNIDLYLMNADGTNPTNLTKQNGNSYYTFAISPDGKTIAAEVYNSTTSGLGTLNIDGTGTKIIQSGDLGWPSFSSDGKKIFMNNYTGQSNISVVNVDGTGLTPLATSGYDYCAIVVGSKVIFQSTRDSTTHTWEDPSMEIYSMNPDGTSITRLTNNSVYDGFEGYGD